VQKVGVCLFISLLLTLLAPLDVYSQQADSKLLPIIQARLGSVRTFQADITVVDRAGADTAKLAGDFLRRADWLKKHKNDDATNLRKSARQLQQPYPETSTVYRYYADKSGWFRIEEFRSPPEEGAELKSKEAAVIRIFKGDRWQEYTPRADAPHEITIHADNRVPVPFFDVARGEAVFATDLEQMTGVDVGKTARITGQLDWQELLNALPPQQRIVDLNEPLIAAGAPRPVLQLSWPSKEKVAPGPSFRAKLWLDPDHGYMPARLQCDLPYENKITGGIDFLRSTLVEWSDPRKTADGTEFAHSCTMRFYYRWPPPLEGMDDQSKWPYVAYEEMVHEFRFSNVRLNFPFEPSLFQVSGPPGTNVADEVSGYAYVLGAAGEQLDKTALGLRNDLPAAREPDKRRFGMVWIYANVVVLLLIGLSYALRRWLKARRA